MIKDEELKEGLEVTYISRDGRKRELGIVSSWNEYFVFVDYGTSHAQATDRADLKVGDHTIAMWMDEIGKVEQCPQRQDSLVYQLSDLVHIANKFGFYDAADFLNNIVKVEDEQ